MSTDADQSRIKKIALTITAIAGLTGVAVLGGLGYASYQAYKDASVETRVKKLTAAKQDELSQKLQELVKLQAMAKEDAAQARITLDTQTKQLEADFQKRKAELDSIHAKKTKELDDAYAAKNKKLEADYDVWNKDLQMKFYGPLDELINASAKPAMTHETRDLHLQLNLRKEIYAAISSKENILYDKTVDGMHVVAKTVKVENGEWVLLTRENANGLISLHTYLVPKEAKSVWDAIPSYTMTFGDDLRINDYYNKATTVSKDGKTVFATKGSVLARYEEQDTKMFGQLRQLYARGPAPLAGAETKAEPFPEQPDD